MLILERAGEGFWPTAGVDLKVVLKHAMRQENPRALNFASVS
jgi:hypothetical protein